MLCRLKIKKIIKKLFPTYKITLKTYRDWWDEHSKSIEDAFFYTSRHASDEEFQYDGAIVTNSFFSLGLCNKENSVLEIGCGVARIGRELAPKVKHYTGVDISQNMLRHARKRTSHLKNVSFLRLKDVNLKMFKNDQFDFVFSTIVFFHLDKEDLFEYLKESFRVLKPNGKAYFDTWNLNSLWTFDRWLSEQAYNVGDKKQFNRARNQFATADEIRRYAESIGFTDIKVLEADLLHLFCKKPISAISFLDKKPKTLFVRGYLDKPSMTELVIGEDTIIKGWALDSEKITEVKVFADGEFVGKADYGQPRPDVKEYFGGIPNSGESGYTFDLKPLNLKEGWHSFKFVAKNIKGDEICVGMRVCKVIKKFKGNDK